MFVHTRPVTPRRVIQTMSLLIAAVVALALPAAASATPKLAVRPTAVAAGSSAAFIATGFRANTTLQLLIGLPRSEAELAATARTNASGAVTIRLKFPAAATPGTYVALGCQAGCRVKANRAFTITKPLVTAAQAIAKVRRILTKNSAACSMKVFSIKAAAAPNAIFRVTARVSTFGNVGDATWVVNRRIGRTTPADQLAFEIGTGCP